MFLAHSFRLRDPWHCEPAPEGGLRWSRVFHRPTGLEPDDELWLVVSGLPAGAQLTVNGHAFPADMTQAPVTPLLADANQIQILLPAAPAACGFAPPATFPYDARLGIVAHS